MVVEEVLGGLVRRRGGLSTGSGQADATTSQRRSSAFRPSRLMALGLFLGWRLRGLDLGHDPVDAFVIVLLDRLLQLAVFGLQGLIPRPVHKLAHHAAERPLRDPAPFNPSSHASAKPTCTSSARSRPAREGDHVGPGEGAVLRDEAVSRPSFGVVFNGDPLRYTSTLVPVAPVQVRVIYCLVPSNLPVAFNTILVGAETVPFALV